MRVRWTAGILGGLVVLAIGWWLSRFAPREPGPVSSPAAATPPTVVAPAIAPRIAGSAAAEVEQLDARMIAAPADASGAQRMRLVRLAAEPDRVARVVEQLGRDAAAPEGWRVAQREFMRADSVVAIVPDGASPVEVATRLVAAGFLVETPGAGDAVVVVRLRDATLDAVPAALAALAAAAPEIVVEPNFLYFPTQHAPNDYNAALHWGLAAIEAPAAWAATTGSADVVVAIIDTGLDTTHADLAANVWINTAEIAGNGIDDDNNGFTDDRNGWNFVNGNGSVADSDSHGTHVAGVIGAVGHNNTGTVGVNWNVRLLPLRVGGLTFDSARTLNALGYVNALRQRGVNIVAVNASFGGTSFSNAFREAIITARERGIVFVAAAGNDGTNNDATPFYPAAYDVNNIIAVGSMHQGGGRSSFSNFGAASVDLVAPGTAVRSTLPGGTYGFKDGTSMAAPHVAGAIALVAAFDPSLNAAQLRARILDQVDPDPARAGR